MVWICQSDTIETNFFHLYTKIDIMFPVTIKEWTGINKQTQLWVFRIVYRMQNTKVKMWQLQISRLFDTYILRLHKAPNENVYFPQ